LFRRGLAGGSNGSIKAHRSSSRSALAMSSIQRNKAEVNEIRPSEQGELVFLLGLLSQQLRPKRPLA
jgi:hypothetical protein